MHGSQERIISVVLEGGGISERGAQVIQIDAAINSGNSGGELLNTDCE